MASPRSAGSHSLSQKSPAFAETGPILHLANPTHWTDLISAPRNYTAVILLTALSPQFQCHACTDFQGQYEQLANSAYDVHRNDEGLVYVQMDFKPELRELWTQARTHFEQAHEKVY